MTDPNTFSGGAPGMWQRPEDLVGTVLADRYRVTKVIGDGGMGTVYLAEHVTLRKKVALKVLKLELCREQTHVDRFLQEARAASMIDHENIVDIVDFGPVPGGSVFFAMEFLEGEDLSNVLRRERRFAWSRARELMLQIVRALKAAHARGIIHRDLKPANCFLVKRSDGRDFIKLLDFGIAKVTDESGEGSGLTRTGAVFGTAKYMAPEQAVGDPADQRTDVYAAAICLYEFLTGNVPFDGDNFMRVLSRHLTEPLTLPSTMAPDARISPVVESIIVKALSKRPEDRFQSMAEFEAAIMAIGPDGNLIGGAVVGPALVGPPPAPIGAPPGHPGGTQVADGPGGTMWLGQGSQGSQGPASQPPEGRGGTIMLSADGAQQQFGEEPGGTVRLGGQWGTSSPPPPVVGAKPEATFMMEGPPSAVGGATPITAHPPVGARGPSYPPPTSVPHPGTAPPPTDRQGGDFTQFAVEKRSKAGFFALLAIGAVVAVGGGGLVAFLLLDNSDEEADRPSPIVAKAPTTKVEAPPEEPEGPVLKPVEPETKEAPEPETKEAAPPETKEVPETKQPETKQPETKQPETKQPPHGGGIKESLSDGDISKGIKKAVKAAQSCGALPTTSYTVQYVIGGDGQVASAKIVGKGAGTSTGNCIVAAVKEKARFPKSKQALRIVTKTFTF